ncbi:tripartite tricarboxylate transporter substrate binding protein [Ancylobacter aquaticus]|nr:tripartite tricarboxylate transporter substrate binding protein [Ancylobacter aquaticus]
MPASAWEPTGDVEILVTVGPGTSPDQLARQFQSIWRKQGTVKNNVIVTNKPGGGGAVGLGYLNNSHAGSGENLAIAGASMVSNKLAGRSPIGCDEVTPIGHVFAEYIGVAVHPDSPIKDANDLLARLKADPQSLSIGIATSRGNSNHQAIALPAKLAGVDVSKLKTVVFQAGSEARTAVMGKHVDVVPASVGSLAKQVEAGQLRLLAISAPERMTGSVADVPTWKELGFDAVVSNWRGLIGPKDMPPEAVTYWEGVVEATMQDPDFKKSADAAFQTAKLMKHDEFAAYCKEEEKSLDLILGDMGIGTN